MYRSVAAILRLKILTFTYYMGIAGKVLYSQVYEGAPYEQLTHSLQHIGRENTATR